MSDGHHPMDCSMTGFPVHQQLLVLVQTYMPINLVMPSNHLILSSPSPPAFSLSQQLGLLQWVSSSNQGVKVLELQSWSWFSISHSNEYSGWFPLGLTGLVSLQVRGTLKSLLQHCISKASILQHSAFFMVQLLFSYMTTGKTVALNRQTLLAK